MNLGHYCRAGQRWVLGWPNAHLAVLAPMYSTGTFIVFALAGLKTLIASLLWPIKSAVVLPGCAAALYWTRMD